ncbi:MAG TPA: hypothetical protein GX399_12785 [Xanthomonadaceae bacterium]|nr:hypothetical protein [Xanthomonadaceae bacterium]
MPSVLQEIAQQFETVDPDKARELRRIEQVYLGFGLNDGAAAQANDSDGATRRLLHYLPRMARMKGFRLYRIGVGERGNGRYAHQAIALLDAGHLPTPGNTLAVLDPVGTHVPTTRDDGSRQYSFEAWQDLQRHYGHGCALLPSRHQS